MLTYEEHFKSKRTDGRHVCTMAAQMAMFRDMKQELAMPENLDRKTFEEWRSKVRSKHTELLCLPDFTPQPDPVMLGCVQRDGYRVEKWEFYPDDYTAVPFLALIPDGASKANPVPGVMCLNGSNYSKEFASGEPMMDHPNGRAGMFPDRNEMAKHLVRNGIAAFSFDNPGIGETSVLTDPALGETQFNTRVHMCHGYLDVGLNYPGITVFHKLCFMKHLERLEYIDQDRIGISSHSLGTEAALGIGLMCDNIKAIVFNEFLHNDLRRYVAITEQDEKNMIQNIGNWHIIPGRLRYFGFPELCAALAPMHLAMTEGGPDEFLNIVKKAYQVCDAEDRLLISYYPDFADPASRTVHDNIPDHGLTREEYYTTYSYCLPPDHSFRAEPALKLLKKAFGMK